MASAEHYFVEWNEDYVSKERGNRVVHYFLKDNFGKSVLAVVGTERSVRHMFYVVSDEFLRVHGADNSIHAGFRWRSRREVVNWLTSMLSRQHRLVDFAMSPRDDPSFDVKGQQIQLASHKGRLARNLKGHQLDISWSGAPWACNKQLKHYPAFHRNGISIGVQSFVFVMAEKENRYIAYLEDMYEDRKGQKRVKVRWFHHNKEVRGAVSLRNPHPKEVFITPYVQIISAECVDGPAIVLTRDHYEKCLAVFPNDLLGGVHFCFRQFKSNRTKPFRLSKLRGYFDQPIFSCFNPDFFEEEEFSTEDDVKVGTKRNRSYREHPRMAYDLSFKKYGLSCKESNLIKPNFSINEKVEFLCQDSGIRGCWFKCTVLEVSRRQMKILYDDIKDEDSGTNLEEWVPSHRVAKVDKLGLRHAGRPTIRPANPSNERNVSFEIGDPADAWWSDGWWEGVISGSDDSKDGIFQIYIPGEHLFLNIEQKNLRVSRDWIGDRWVDVESSPDILRIISATNMDDKLSTSSAVFKETKPEYSPSSCHKLSTIQEEIHDLDEMTLTNVPLTDDCTGNEQHRVVEAEETNCANNVEDKEKADTETNDANIVINSSLIGGGVDDQRNDFDDGSKVSQLAECEAETAAVLLNNLSLLNGCHG